MTHNIGFKQHFSSKALFKLLLCVKYEVQNIQASVVLIGCYIVVNNREKKAWPENKGIAVSEYMIKLAK